MSDPGTPSTGADGPARVAGVEAVVVDIEGTTSPTSAVVGTLYPYARARMARWITDHAEDAEVRHVLGQVRQLIGEPAADTARVVAALDEWLERDEKVAPLKALQGQIWAAGFALGELTGLAYPDVVPALRAWHDAGCQLAVYSSGSAAAQRAWFSRLESTTGVTGGKAEDLTPLLTACFDLDNIGPKTVPASYTVIATALGVSPAQVLFLTDRPAEIDAATAAGLQVLGIARPGEPYAEVLRDIPHVTSFAEVDLLR